jgi:hypothetical protein
MFEIISFRSKTLDVIIREFNYNPAIPGVQSASFEHATKIIKDQGGNEYEAAVAFMLEQVKQVPSNDPNAAAWTQAIVSTCAKLVAKGKINKDSSPQ